MKNIFKSSLIACVALTAGLTGCLKGPEVDGENGTKSVFIKISRAADTRAVGDAVTAGENGDYVALTTANFYFTNGSNIVETKVLTGVDLDMLQGDGYEFTNLSATIKSVHIIGNQPDLLGGFNSIDDLLADNAVTMANQSDITEVTLYGTDGLEPADPNSTNPENDHYTATVELNPVVSRLEIGAISAATGTALVEPAITSFTLEGIYLDGVYEAMGIDFSSEGEVTEAGKETAFYNGGNHVADLTMDTPKGFEEANSYYPFVMNGEDKVAKVWGYNLLPVADASLPTVVLKVSNVILENGDGIFGATEANSTGVLFLTANSTHAFEPGYIYTTELVFNASDLTEEPNQKKIDVTIIATVMPWKTADVNYVF